MAIQISKLPTVAQINDVDLFEAAVKNNNGTYSSRKAPRSQLLSNLTTGVVWADGSSINSSGGIFSLSSTNISITAEQVVMPGTARVGDLTSHEENCTAVISQSTTTSGQVCLALRTIHPGAGGTAPYLVCYDTSNAVHTVVDDSGAIITNAFVVISGSYAASMGASGINTTAGGVPFASTSTMLAIWSDVGGPNQIHKLSSAGGTYFVLYGDNSEHYVQTVEANGDLVWYPANTTTHAGGDVSYGRAGPGLVYIASGNGSTTKYVNLGTDGSGGALYTAVAPAQTANAQSGKSATVQAAAAVDGSSGHAAQPGGDVPLLPAAGVNGGRAGVVIIRKPGGTPGTDEVWLSHSSGRTNIADQDGNSQVLFSFGGGNCLVVTSANVDTNDSSLCASGNNGFWVGNGQQFLSSVPGNAPDIGLKRVALNVYGSTNGSSGDGWLRNSAGEAVLASNFTDATGTLAATNLSWPVVSGESYDIDLLLKVSNTTAADGFQMDFNGGGASVSVMWIEATIDNGGSVVAGTTTSMALNDIINYTTVTGTVYICLRGRITASSTGTFVLRAATNTHVSGTMTLAALSGGCLRDTVKR